MGAINMGIFSEYIPLKEAGAISGYHPDYIGALVRANKVKGKKIGKNWFVSKKDIQEYFRERHYAPVGKVLSTKAKVLFFCLVLVIVGGVALYFFGASQTQSSPVVVQSALSDVVGTQADQDSPQNDIAEVIPVIHK